MSRIVFCWELGAGYGHLARLLPIALSLRQRGHEPTFVIRDLLGAERLLTPHGIPALQAPLWLGNVQGLPGAHCHPELLMRLGFLDGQALTGIARAWQHLLQLLEPDLLVLDHAPTALLASRHLKVPRMLLGDGFCLPPRQTPMPPFAWWTKNPNQARLADSEKHVVANANIAAKAMGAPPLRSLAELYECEASFMTGFPDTDPYRGVRSPGAPFHGPIFDLGQGAAVDWPDTPGPKIFAYLKPDYAGLTQALTALRSMAASVLVHVPGASRKTCETYSCEHLHLSPEPLDMETLRHSCDLVMAHGGAGTTSAALLAGKPLLLLPMQTEQNMSAHVLSAQGLAVALGPDQLQLLPELLRKLLNADSFRHKAAEFARRHANFDQKDVVALAAGQCEKLLVRAPSEPLAP